MSGLNGRRSAAIVGLLATALVTLTACQGEAPLPSTSRAPGQTGATPSKPAGTAIDLTDPSYKPEAGKNGGSIVIGDWQQANQFNPYYLGLGTEPAVASAAWATLVSFTHDERYLPDLAAALPTVDNGGVKLPGDDGDAMTVTWKLRDGLKWSDGEALTCDDFKYAWEWVLDDNNFGVVSSGYADIKGFDCPSDTAMVWHFRDVFQGYLTLMKAPLPRHVLQSIPMQDQAQGMGFRPDEVSKLPVSGPFKFESIVPDVELRLVRNPNYTSPRTGQPAYLDSLTFRWYPDRDAVIAAYRAGKINVATGLTDADLEGVADLGDQVSTRSSLLYESFRPNWSADACSTSAAVTARGTGCPMADPAMRKAVAQAIDTNAIATSTLGASFRSPATGVSPLAWFYEKGAAPAFDPASARQTLESAGWTDPDGDGIRERDGLDARIEFCTTASQARLDTVTLAAAALKDIGIEAVPREVDAADMFAAYDRANRQTPCALRRGNFDLALQSLASSIDPSDYFFRYHSSQFEPDGENDASVSNVGIDVALDTVKSTVNPAVITDAMAEFQKTYLDQTVEIPIYFQQTVELQGSKLSNAVGGSLLGGVTWNAADWFVKG